MGDDAATPLMSAGARRLVLLAAAACLLPLLLRLPPPLGTGFGLGALVVAGLAWQRPLPALLRLLLGAAALLAVAWVSPGIGRDTACAVLAAMLALKPSETFSRRDGRSLLGFGLFAPFATFLLDQGPTSLLLALLAVTLALLALQRLAAEEGEVPATGTAGLVDAGTLASVGKLLALGLPLALAAFWLFPRLPNPLWGLPERAIATPGLSDSMSPGGWLDLMVDDSPAARVQFFGPTPTPEQMYWRGPVLWDFDGRTWRMARDLRFFPPPKLAVEADGWDYQVDLEPTDNRQLIALDLPTRMPEGTWTSLDYTVWAGVPQHNVSRWRMRSAPAVEDAPALHPRLRSRALALPPGFNPRTLALGRQWRREAGTDPRGAADRAIAQRALALIRRDFAYTLDVPLSGRNEVDDFLFERREGYCEHFSSAFTVLMRAAGIPARVVTGYAGGYRNPVGGYWLVRKSDAHAWVEIWLPDRGWTRVDPTAAVAPENVYDTIADRQPGRIGNLTALVPVFNASDWLRRGWNDFVLGFNAQRQQALLSRLGIGKLDPRQLVALFALVAAMSLAAMAWTLARGERERDPLLRAWHALERRYRRIDRGRRPHEPALAWARRVAADSPRAGEHLLALAQRFSDARYAPPASIDRQSLLRALARHRP